MGHIDEFQSPNFHGIAQQSFLLLCMVAIAALAARRIKPRLVELMLILFAVASGMYASRNLPTSAILLTLENRNYFGNQGQGYLLTAIASVLIGGTSIFGGRATIIGTIFGCFIIGMIEAGLVATGLTGAWVRTIQGLVFLASIVFYLYIDEPQRRSALFAKFKWKTEFG